MKRVHLFLLSFGFSATLLCVGVLVPEVGAETVPPVTLPKAQIRVVRTECLVVATEAKRIAPAFTAPDLYGRELWTRNSENVNPCPLGYCLFDLLNIEADRDVLNNGAAPSGLGWLPNYIDSLQPTWNQRHHFGFHFYVGTAGGWAALVAMTGGTLNDFIDAFTGNSGDLQLSEQAETLGRVSTGANQLPLVAPRIKAWFCAPGN